MRCSNRLLSAIAVAAALAGSACTDPEVAKRGYLDSGNTYATEGKFQQAIVQYRNAIQQDPRYGEARWQLAQAYEKTKNAPGAFQEVIRAADLLPERPEVQLKAATYLLLAQRFEDAKTRAELALKTDPDNLEALIVRANGTAGLKDLPGAIRDIEEALASRPADGRLYTSLGAFRLLEGQKVEAEAAFKKAIEVTPKSVEARLALANFYWATGRASDVERALTEARALDPAHLLLNRMLASFYLSTQRAREAEAPLVAFADRAADSMSKLVLADYYVQMQRPNDAIGILEPLAKKGDTAGAATLRLAQIERNAGRKDSARLMIEGLLEKEPRNVAALTLKSTWQLRDGDTAGAIKTARAATEADPASAPAQFALGQSLFQAQQSAEAVTALSEALRLNPRIASAQLMLSRLQLAAGNADAAVQFASDAKKAEPGNPDVQLALARSLLAKGDVQQAEPEVKALLAKYPQVAASHTIDGLLRMAKRDRDGARAAFGRALERDPNSAEALEGLLVADVASNSVAAAVARIEDRVARHPQSAPLLFVAARTYAAARQFDKTEKTLRSVLQIDPNNFSAYVLLGRTYVSQRRLDEALAEFDAAAAKQPTQVGVATMAAMLLQMQNKQDEAQKRYEAIVATSQRAPVAANNLAWIYAERGGNLDIALQHAQAAKAQLPDVPEINDTLGWIYYKKDLPELAIPPLEQSASKDPKNALYQLHLGLAYAKAGQKDKARTALEAALKLQPNLPEAEEARRALAAM